MERDDSAETEGVDRAWEFLSDPLHPSDRLTTRCPWAVEQVRHEPADREVRRAAETANRLQVVVEPGASVDNRAEATIGVRLQYGDRPLEQGTLATLRIARPGNEIGRYGIPRRGRRPDELAELLDVRFCTSQEAGEGPIVEVDPQPPPPRTESKPSAIARRWMTGRRRTSSNESMTAASFDKCSGDPGSQTRGRRFFRLNPATTSKD
jgi:hypothetical protein